jgi:hypothetical protein
MLTVTFIFLSTRRSAYISEGHLRVPQMVSTVEEGRAKAGVHPSKTYEGWAMLTGIPNQNLGRRPLPGNYGKGR